MKIIEEDEGVDARRGEDIEEKELVNSVQKIIKSKNTT